MVAEVWYAEAYGGPIGNAILSAKSRGDRALAQVISGHIAGLLAIELSNVDLVVPVPSPWTRRLARGFSLSSVLAIPIAERLGRPVLHRALIAKRGQRQASLDVAARSRGLVGRIRSRTPVSGTVLLVDDVFTTGATASACARELLGAGADRVVVAVACATLKTKNANDS